MDLGWTAMDLWRIRASMLAGATMPKHSMIGKPNMFQKQMHCKGMQFIEFAAGYKGDGRFSGKVI